MTALSDAHLPASITIRRVETSDQDAVLELHEGLDAHDCFFRFFGACPAQLPRVAATIARADHEHLAVGAFLGDRLVGVANYIRADSSASAEIAMVVAHDVQLHGIGTALLHRLGEVALAAGVHRFTADVLTENARMLRVIRECGHRARFRTDGSVVEVEIDLDEEG